MRMKSRLSLFCACIIMAVAVQVAFAGADARQKSAPKATVAKAQQKTPVLVQAYYPFSSQHKFIADYLKKYQKAHAKDVTLELYDQQTPEGRKAWMKTGPELLRRLRQWQDEVGHQAGERQDRERRFSEAHGRLLVAPGLRDSREADRRRVED